MRSQVVYQNQLIDKSKPINFGIGSELELLSLDDRSAVQLDSGKSYDLVSLDLSLCAFHVQNATYIDIVHVFVEDFVRTFKCRMLAGCTAALPKRILLNHNISKYSIYVPDYRAAKVD